MNKELWTTVRLAIMVSPFWFLAGNITDGDELIKTLTGTGMVAAATLFPNLKKMVTDAKISEGPNA